MKGQYEDLKFRKKLLNDRLASKTSIFDISKELGYSIVYLIKLLSKEKEITFNFGVELETKYEDELSLPAEFKVFYRVSYHGMPNGFNIKDQYQWRQTWDGSLGCHGEYVSPILQGEQGLRILNVFCNALNAVKAKVDDSCGLHVHIDRAHFDGKGHIDRFIQLYTKLESSIDNIMTKKRRGNNNNYCRTMTNYDRDSRYHKVNITNRHTIEVRHHYGTVDFKTIEYWIRILGVLVEESRLQVAKPVNSLIEIVSPKVKMFVKNKEKELA